MRLEAPRKNLQRSQPPLCQLNRRGGGLELGLGLVLFDKGNMFDKGNWVQETWLTSGRHSKNDLYGVCIILSQP